MKERLKEEVQELRQELKSQEDVIQKLKYIINHKRGGESDRSKLISASESIKNLVADPPPRMPVPSSESQENLEHQSTDESESSGDPESPTKPQLTWDFGSAHNN